MGTPDTTAAARRNGLTLIELLVAMAIILVLVTLTALLAPSLADKHRVAKSADLVQQWLLISRQRALRDQAPRGVRLVLDADGHARKMVYIEEPEPFTGGILVVQDANTAYCTADLWGGYSQAEPHLWPVQPGDYLQLTESANESQMFRIVDVQRLVPPIQGPPGWPQFMFQIRTQGSMPVATPLAATLAYKIHRSPRPLPGEAELVLPKGVIIDMSPLNPAADSWGSIVPPEQRFLPNPSGIPTDPPTLVSNHDVVFAPSGNVIRVGGTVGKIILWVREEDQLQATGATLRQVSGDETLIVVYTRTGQSAAHPVEVTRDQNGRLINPYAYTQDGRASGL
jgi:prepilin-type N-terminal cleavage/methylation domain-containing protein